MTQIYITIGIIALIAVLVCYVFIRQTLGEKRQEKERLKRILAKRANDLLQMISVFPDNFLPKELTVFVYRCIIDAYEQLTKLVPDEQKYIDALKLHTSQLEATVRKPDAKKHPNLQSVTQINELRQYLNLLGGFLQKSLKRQNISQKQHAHYRQLIKELIIRLAVNNYMLSAKQALDMQKTKLSIHYYDLAKKLLIKETPSHYKEAINDIDQAIAPLLEMEKAERAEQEALANEAAAHAEDSEKSEWQEFEEESGWKKKNVYD